MPVLADVPSNTGVSLQTLPISESSGFDGESSSHHIDAKLIKRGAAVRSSERGKRHSAVLCAQRSMAA